MSQNKLTHKKCVNFTNKLPAYQKSTKKLPAYCHNRDSGIFFCCCCKQRIIWHTFYLSTQQIYRTIAHWSEVPTLFQVSSNMSWRVWKKLMLQAATYWRVSKLLWAMKALFIMWSIYSVYDIFHVNQMIHAQQVLFCICSKHINNLNCVKQV